MPERMSSRSDRHPHRFDARSFKQRAQPPGAIIGATERPAHFDAQRPALQRDANITVSAAIRGDANRQERGLGGMGGLTSALHRRARNGTSLAIDNPASQQVGIQAVGKGQRRRSRRRAVTGNPAEPLLLREP